MTGNRSSNKCYLVRTGKGSPSHSLCLASKQDELTLWHQHLGHLHLRGLTYVAKHRLVNGIPNLQWDTTIICGNRKTWKMTKASHKWTDTVQILKIVDLIHMDLLGPFQVESLGGKKYVLVCVDNFSRFSWIAFLKEKLETVETVRHLIIRLQRESETFLKAIQKDHGREFENSDTDQFWSDQGIDQQYSAAITPQQNVVTERKNRSLQETTEWCYMQNNCL